MEVSRILLVLFLVLLSGQCSGEYTSIRNEIVRYSLQEVENVAYSQNISPSVDPQPLYPLQAPPPMLLPFTYTWVPKLSGLCPLNFSSDEDLLTITAHDCWAPLAPYLANVMCCPQFTSTLSILIGQSSNHTHKLGLDPTHARHCLSDITKILEGQGVSKNLLKICSAYSSDLTKSSCPIEDVREIERTVNTSALVTACEKIDPAEECCDQVCTDVILDTAEKLAEKNGIGKNSSTINDCKQIVTRWIASILDPVSVNGVLRGLSSCSINKACPLLFPDLGDISKQCGKAISNKAVFCNAVEDYLSKLQKQSLVTNLQAVNCASSLSMKLQKADVSSNVYELCQIKLKDFSLQVDSKDSGCLLPSLPSDVTYDETSGIGFICDLDDNLQAPWSSDSLDSYACNRTNFPELPTATSSHSRIRVTDSLVMKLFVTCLFILKLIA